MQQNSKYRWYGDRDEIVSNKWIQETNIERIQDKIRLGEKADRLRIVQETEIFPH